jgi:hypothetical protein
MRCRNFCEIQFWNYQHITGNSKISITGIRFSTKNNRTGTAGKINYVQKQSIFLPVREIFLNLIQIFFSLYTVLQDIGPIPVSSIPVLKI